MIYGLFDGIGYALYSTIDIIHVFFAILVIQEVEMTSLTRRKHVDAGCDVVIDSKALLTKSWYLGTSRFIGCLGSNPSSYPEMACKMI